MAQRLVLIVDLCDNKRKCITDEFVDHTQPEIDLFVAMCLGHIDILRTTQKLNWRKWRVIA